MRYQQLGNSGSLVSQFGFGASPLSGVYGSIAEHDGIHARGSEIAKLALQFAVTTGNYTTTVVGTASAADLRRNIAWIEEPVDDDLLTEVASPLAPVHDRGWINGRPDNQNPGSPPRSRRSSTVTPRRRDSHRRHP